MSDHSTRSNSPPGVTKPSPSPAQNTGEGEPNIVLSENNGSISLPDISSLHKVHTGPSDVIDSFPRKSRVQNPWANIEDQILCETVSTSPRPLLWPKIAMCLPGRSAKQCRERWTEHLDPSFDRSPFSMEEDAIILQGQKQLGNKWRDISSFFTKKLRTPSSIKVRWHFLDRQIKKYGANSEGLPNYPHISYAFAKQPVAVVTAPHDMLPAGSEKMYDASKPNKPTGIQNGIQNERVVNDVPHVSNSQHNSQNNDTTSAQERGSLSRNNLVKYTDLHQMQNQNLSSQTHGVNSFIPPAPIHMMNGFPPQSLGAVKGTTDGSFMNNTQQLYQYPPHPMYMYNPASMLYPYTTTTTNNDQSSSLQYSSVGGDQRGSFPPGIPFFPPAGFRPLMHPISMPHSSDHSTGVRDSGAVASTYGSSTGGRTSPSKHNSRYENPASKRQRYEDEGDKKEKRSIAKLSNADESRSKSSIYDNDDDVESN